MIKDCASIDDCRAEILRAYIKAIQPIFLNHGKLAIITSGSEKFKHSAKRSRHYSGDALDLRSKHLDNDKKMEVLEELKEALGDDFVVLLEGLGKPYEHYHIHYAPVYQD